MQVLILLGIYPEELVPEKSFFQLPSRTKIHRIYQRLLKEVNGDQKYLRCSFLLDNDFEVLSAAITLDKVDLVCAEVYK